MPRDPPDDAVGIAVSSSDPTIARLMAFCDDQQVMRKHDRFFRDRAGQFLGFHADDEEKSHAVHEAFQEYERLFEETVNAFLDEEGV
ncbi:hypothetical protein ATCC90586_008213 [Pythium insidiosum]|nr:hypothetical protein ATCC90586_008213 [Pythium insidiosum]